MTDSTRSRADLTFAFWSPKKILALFRCWLRPAPKGLDISRVSDHLARDIGLSETDLEQLRMTLPSQVTYHPRG